MFVSVEAVVSSRYLHHNFCFISFSNRSNPFQHVCLSIFQYVRPCIAEMLQLVIFVFIGTLSVANRGGIVGIAIAHGLTIALLVAGFGGIR